MTAVPSTTPIPSVFVLPISAKPTPTPAPAPSKQLPSEEAIKPTKHKFKLPALRLEIRDLNHAGADVFLSAVIASKALATSVQSVLSLLYQSPTSNTTTVPGTRSVTLILRSMLGVAYTTGSDLDSDHKEIHFSLEYINRIASERRDREIMGVLTHEMVHCYQYNAYGTCPGGLIEGIADWIRLKSDLSPPHWKKETSGKWDAGYQHTGYFLEYLEKRFGEGLIRRINEKLRIERYQEKKFWTELCGGPVGQLWADYQKVLERGENKTEEVIYRGKEDTDAPDDPAMLPTPTVKDGSAGRTRPAEVV